MSHLNIISSYLACEQNHNLDIMKRDEMSIQRDSITPASAVSNDAMACEEIQDKWGSSRDDGASTDDDYLGIHVCIIPQLIF